MNLFQPKTVIPAKATEGSAQPGVCRHPGEGDRRKCRLRCLPSSRRKRPTEVRIAVSVVIPAKATDGSAECGVCRHPGESRDPVSERIRLLDPGTPRALPAGRLRRGDVITPAKATKGSADCGLCRHPGESRDPVSERIRLLDPGFRRGDD